LEKERIMEDKLRRMAVLGVAVLILNGFLILVELVIGSGHFNNAVGVLLLNCLMVGVIVVDLRRRRRR
jgi:hypothetical protein